jgi:hypothetical protein
MAKLNAYIVNPEAQVTVHLRDPVSIRKFANLAAFEAWYSPKAHYFIGALSQEGFTDISIDLTGRAVDEVRRATLVSMGAKHRNVTPNVPSSARVWATAREHRSVLAAFETLGLNIKAHQKFRRELKVARKLVYKEGAREIAFEYR